MGFCSQCSFRPKKVTWFGALDPEGACLITLQANPGTSAKSAPGQLAPGPAGRSRLRLRSAPEAGRRVAGWPLSLPPLCPFYLRLSRRPGGPLCLSLPPPRLHRHFNARQVAGCCYFEGAGGPGAPRATADPDRRRRLTGALGHRRGCARHAPVRSSPFRS